MSNFKIRSTYFENIYSISQREITNKTCTIHINNNKEIEIPLLVAVSFSTLISQMLLSDPLMTDFYVEDSSLDNVKDDIYNKFEDLLNLKEIQLDSEERAQIAILGKVLENNELLAPFLELMKEYEQNLNEDNVISLIQQKMAFNIPIDELNNEISYIASNFSNFVDKLIDLGNDIKYSNIIECVVKHENIQMDSEDDLLLFVISLCKHNHEYERLFEYIWLEYCSVESISHFVEYLNENICKDNRLKSIIKCINRRLIQDQIPIKNIDLMRYNFSIIEYNESEPLNGILRHEYLKDNVEMRTSGTSNGDVYDLLKNSKEVDFCTKDEPNSWFEGNLKTKKPFTITKYVIRGRKYKHSDGYGHLQSWKLEGHRVSDGEWIELDSHQNEPFDQFVLRTFSIQSKEKFDIVRLTQIGKNTGNYDDLKINAFDIFGCIHSH